eukprot:2377946-Pleurochrysis_carterae.AAC.1
MLSRLFRAFAFRVCGRKYLLLSQSLSLFPPCATLHASCMHRPLTTRMCLYFIVRLHTSASL